MMLALSLATLVGCGGAGPQVKNLNDPDPASKIPAIKQKVREKDLTSAEQLVKDLGNDDPAVRFYAIEGLRRLTGETFDYHYYQDEEQRKPAVEKWQQWLASQKGTIKPS